MHFGTEAMGRQIEQTATRPDIQEPLAIESFQTQHRLQRLDCSLESVPSSRTLRNRDQLLPN